MIVYAFLSLEYDTKIRKKIIFSYGREDRSMWMSTYLLLIIRKHNRGSFFIAWNFRFTYNYLKILKEFSLKLKQILFSINDFVEKENNSPCIPINNVTNSLQAILGISERSVYRLINEMK